MMRDLRDCNILRKERPRAGRLVRFRKFNRQKLQSLITLTSSIESPTALENNTVCERLETVTSCKNNLEKNLASVDNGSSSIGLFPVPKSLFLSTCSLDKIKNRVQASVALVADFQSRDIDVGIISETHLCRQKLDSTVAIEGYTAFKESSV